jgi:hypothetical protein
MVNHPPHYSAHPSGIECIVITREMTFDVGNAVKYIYRCDAKNGRQDIEKAEWYLKDAIEHVDGIMATLNVSDTRKRLDLVLLHETDYHRVQFFRSIRNGQLDLALEAVQEMLSKV